MASVHRQRRSPYWYAAFYGPDGRRCFRSTGTGNKTKAMEIAAQFERTAREARKGRLTEARVRATLGDLLARVNGSSMATVTTMDFLEGWLENKARELSEGSLPEYRKAVEHLHKILGARANQPIDIITRLDATRFRDELAKRLSAATANKYLKIARVAWTDAQRDGLVSENVFSLVKTLKPNAAKRRPFTLPELKAVLDACDVEWRGMVLAGLYTGQRLGDIASLTWQQIDFEQNEIRFITRKTGKSLVIPVADPLRGHLLSIAGVDDAAAPVFRSSFECASNTLGRRFSEILMAAKLIPKVGHGKRSGKGRDSRRSVGGLCFHCLRHTATSLLKNAGVSDGVAKQIIGHESDAVSRAYTHIETDSLKRAIEGMPDVTK